jgi:hypothetical protein
MVGFSPKGEGDPSDDDEDVPPSSKREGEGFAALADSLFDAVQDGDKEGFRATLKAAIKACTSDYED